MDSDDQFDHLAQRDAEITTLVIRGRRRALAMMLLVFLPSPFLVMWLNHDSSFASIMPIGIACFGGISYSWTKWRRRPEDTQSVAFVGLDRSRRGATYRSVRRGTPIEDPVVLTIVESIDHHLRRSVWSAVAGVLTVAAMAVALVAFSGGGAGAVVAAVAIGVMAIGVLGAHRWVMNRMGLVLARGRLH